MRVALFVAAVASFVLVEFAAGAAAVVTIDGAPVAGAVSKDGHLLVPFRAPMEQIGATIDWSDATQTGIASDGGHELVRVKVADPTAYIEGNAKDLTVAPVLINHLEYIPVEILPEISNAQIALSSDGNTATITGFDLGGIDAAGMAAATIDPGGKLVWVWIAILPILGLLSYIGFTLADRSLKRQTA